MVRTFAFTVKGELHTRDVPPFLMPTLLSDTNLFLWVDLEAPTSEEVRLFLEGVFHFHPLSIEDCIAEHPVPKIEEYTPREGELFDPYLFFVMNTVEFDEATFTLRTDALNFFLGRNFLVTFHGRRCLAVEGIAERCLRGVVFPAQAPDRVAYMLLDALAEGYRFPLRSISEALGLLEEQVLEEGGENLLGKMIQFRKHTAILVRTIEPQLNLLWKFANGEFHLVRPKTVPYFRDVYDALHSLLQQAQSYNETLTNLLQVYLNISSYRTSEVVKLLTVITVLTTPMMLIGTWYGMNFEYMPELAWPWAYPVAVILTLVLTIAIGFYFRKKRWL